MKGLSVSLPRQEDGTWVSCAVEPLSGPGGGDSAGVGRRPGGGL